MEYLSSDFKLRVIVLDPSNIGTKVKDILIEGPEAAEMAMKWAYIFLVTGTTLVNGTIGNFLRDKPVIFYGATLAGVVYLTGWERLSAFGS